MARAALLLGLLGFVAATLLLVWSGWGQIAAALAQAGWGIAAIAVLHMGSIILSGTGWRALLPWRRGPETETGDPTWAQFVLFMWVRAAVNNLMPVARIGGEFVAVRLMTAAGMPRLRAIAATVVELTLSVLAVFLFVTTGTVLFVLHIGDAVVSRRLLEGIAGALAGLVALAGAQKAGLFGLIAKLLRARLHERWASLAGDAALLDRAIGDLYRNHWRIAGCGLLQLAAWSLGAVEIWLSLRFLGFPLPPTQCVMIEALIQGSSSAAFAVPGALGVQEAGFLFFGGMLGLPHAAAAACALVRRCRDLLCYAPGLLVWQAQEGHRWLRR